MRLPEYIIKMLRKKSGNDLYLPSDCEFLSLDIESNLGIHIGATTLKRLLGFTNDERTPHASTLEVLAKYANCVGKDLQITLVDRQMGA